MITLKKTAALITLLTLTSSLTACATTYNRGNGIVIAEKKIHEKDYKPHAATQTGAVTGATLGGVGGAMAGLIFGFAPGVVAVILLTHTITLPIVAGVAITSAAIGAVAGGAAGGAVGGGIGYAVDANTPNAGVYEFTVQTDKELPPLTITQYTTPIPLNTPVQILEKNNLLLIKPGR